MRIFGRNLDRILSVRELILLESSRSRSKITRGTDGSKSKPKSVKKFMAVTELLRTMRLRQGKEYDPNKMNDLIEKLSEL